MSERESTYEERRKARIAGRRALRKARRRQPKAPDPEEETSRAVQDWADDHEIDRNDPLVRDLDERLRP